MATAFLPTRTAVSLDRENLKEGGYSARDAHEKKLKPPPRREPGYRKEFSMMKDLG